MPWIPFIVGEPYPHKITPWSPGIRFEVNTASINIVFVCQRPTQREINNWGGHAEWALTRYSSRLFFMMYTSPSLIGWADMPFSCCITSPREGRGTPEREPKQGYLVNIGLVDFHSRLIVDQRLATMSPGFSETLDRLVGEQMAQGDMPRPVYHSEIDSAYRRWPTSEDMLRDAHAREPIGLKFHDPRVTPGPVWTPPTDGGHRFR